MADPRRVYVYRADEAKGEMLIANDANDLAEEVFSSIRRKIAGTASLPSSLKLRVYPLGYVESEIEALQRAFFKKENYLLVAATVNSDFEVTNFLLVEKASRDSGIIVSFPRLEAIVAIHGGIAIGEEDTITPLSIYLESLSGRLPLSSGETHKAPPNLGYVKTKEEEPEEEDFVAPTLEKTFTPTSKKAIRNLGFGSVKKKPSEKPVQAKIETPVPTENEEIEEEAELEIHIDKPTFSPSSKKKIRNLDAEEKSAKRKPKKALPEPRAYEKKPKIPAKPVEIPVEPAPIAPIEKPSFSPVSNKKPRNLDRVQLDWRAKPSGSFNPSNTKKNSILAINDPNETGPLDFAYETDRLFRRGAFEITPNAIFVPTLLSSDDQRLAKIRHPKKEEWHILASYLDSYGRPYCDLICLRDDPHFAIIALTSGSPKVVLVSAKGFSLFNSPMSYESLILRSFAPKKETAKEEPPAIEEEPIQVEEEPIQEEIPIFDSLPEKETPRRIAKRRVFVTERHAREMRKFFSAHPEAEEEYDELLAFLLSCEDEEIERKIKDPGTKTIVENLPLPVYKFPFSNAKEYAASRLFFIRGHNCEDLRRKFRDDDFIILGFSNHQQHERQGKIARDALYYFLGDVSCLTEMLLPESEGDALDEMAYLSQYQWAALDQNKAAPPAAFVGTAGSGKTLLSYQAYCDLAGSGSEMKVLYLTYQRALVKEARRKLSELGLTEVEAYTYRELIETIFGKKEADKFRDKKRFRNWFFDKCERLYDKDFVRHANRISPSKEDAFLIAYVFYRGIIEGAMENADKGREAILGEEEFLRKVKNEEGFSLEQKKAIYAIALSYEKHLVKHNGLTDNKFALKILSRDAFFGIYDAIIVDEYQDLSELQLLGLTRLLKDELPHRLYLFGDDNQAVNPTILTISSVGSVVRKAFKERNKLSVASLLSSYRSGPNLLTYINELMEVKDQVIGKDKKENAAARASFREDESDYFVTLIEDPSLMDSLLEAIKKNNSDVVFLFPSALSRDEGKKRVEGRFDKGFLDSNFLSVEESKGREWDSVVLVDFFSTNKELFEKMLGEERAGKHSTVHRMLFNRYYVALTRAKNRAIIFESDLLDAPKTKATMLSSLTLLKKKEDIAKIFEGTLSPDYWIASGDKAFKKEDYEAALRAYRRAYESPKASERLVKAESYEKATSLSLGKEESANVFLRYEDYEHLLAYYVDTGQSEKESLLSLLLDESTPLKEVASLYQERKESLYESEQVAFYGILIDRYDKAIRTRLARTKHPPTKGRKRI